MYKRLLYILSLAFALTNFLLPAQAAPDINIDEDVAEEPAKATAYRFWIDDNTKKTEASLYGEDIEINIDVSSLNVGIHIYHIQLKDQYGRWGTTTDIPFYAGYQNTDVKEDDSTIPPVEKIIYWIDDDFDNKVTQAYKEADMTFEQDISNLAGGKHSYSLIAFNSQNRAAAITGSFYLPTTDGSDDESGEKEVITIVSYQYWVDDDKANAKTLPYTSDDISQQIDYTQLAEGVHTLHFRLRNNEGIWSNYEYPFYTPGTNSIEQAETQQPITGYRYGVDGKTVTKDITEVDNVPALSVEIPFPTAQEFANVEDYEFTTDNASNDVKVKRVGDLTYFIQFKNKLGNWGEPVFIKVWYKVNGIFIDVREHLHGNFTKSCLCISHCSGTVTVDGTKVSMTINKRISCRPVLCHVDQCSIDGTVSMWMVFTHGITDNTRTFSVWLVRSII